MFVITDSLTGFRVRRDPVLITEELLITLLHEGNRKELSMVSHFTGMLNGVHLEKAHRLSLVKFGTDNFTGVIPEDPKF